MKSFLQFSIIASLLVSCHKENNVTQTNCNMQQIYADNEKKVTITSGIWGTISNMEGNCMPMISPSISTCKDCPIQRTIKIYQYTLLSQATPSDGFPGFFDSLNATLVAEVVSDKNGFFQTNIPPGHYSMAIVENGRLYISSTDGQGGINPFTYTNGIQKLNMIMTYGAVF